MASTKCIKKLQPNKPKPHQTTKTNKVKGNSCSQDKPSCFQPCTYVSDSQFFLWANQPLGIYRRLFFVDLGVILMAVTYHFTYRETEEHRDMTWLCVRKQQVCISPFLSRTSFQKRVRIMAQSWFCAVHLLQTNFLHPSSEQKNLLLASSQHRGLSNTEVLGLLQAGRQAGLLFSSSRKVYSSCPRMYDELITKAIRH